MVNVQNNPSSDKSVNFFYFYVNREIGMGKMFLKIKMIKRCFYEKRGLLLKKHSTLCKNCITIYLTAHYYIYILYLTIYKIAFFNVVDNFFYFPQLKLPTNNISHRWGVFKNKLWTVFSLHGVFGTFTSII